MNGILSNSSAKYPKVHILKDGKPLCGASARSFVWVPLLDAENNPCLSEHGLPRMTRKTILHSLNIQTDLGEPNCKKCLSKK